MIPVSRARTLCRSVLVVAVLLLAIGQLGAVAYRSVHVVAQAANVRSGPGMGHEVLFVANWGSRLIEIDREEAPWVRVQSPDWTTEGWIHGSLVSPENPKRRGRGSIAGVGFAYYCETDSLVIHVSPPVSWDAGGAGPVLREVIARAFGERVALGAENTVFGDLDRGVQVNGETRRYLFRVTIGDSLGVESVHARWSEDGGLPN